MMLKSAKYNDKNFQQKGAKTLLKKSKLLRRIYIFTINTIFGSIYGKKSVQKS